MVTPATSAALFALRSGECFVPPQGWREGAPAGGRDGRGVAQHRFPDVEATVLPWEHLRTK